MMDFDAITVSCVLLFTKTLTKIEMYYEKIYNSNENVRKIAWFVKYIYSLCRNKLIEPYENQWISKSVLLPDKDLLTGSYSYIENYNIDYKTLFFRWFHNSESFDEISTKYFSLYNYYYPNCGELTILKTEYNDKVCYLTGKKCIDRNEPKESTAKFMIITYEHPFMTEGIDIDLPRCWFYINNELFTPVFLYRLLKSQDKPFVFDNLYKVNIMDSDCGITELNSKSYIVLTDDSYQIKTLDSELLELDKNKSYNHIIKKVNHIINNVTIGATVFGCIYSKQIFFTAINTWFVIRCLLLIFVWGYYGNLQVGLQELNKKIY